MLAAMAASGDKLPLALQIGFCHLFFNISGILLFYPVPFTRVPIRLAKMMGNTTARYRWFAILYLVTMFFLLPGLVFALSMLGMIPMLIIFSLFVLLLAFVLVVNVLQRKRPKILPAVLRNWEFLPECLHSLDPVDRALCKVRDIFVKVFPCCKASATSKTEIPVIIVRESDKADSLKLDSTKAFAIEMLLLDPNAPGKAQTPNTAVDGSADCDSGVSSYASSATQSLANSRYPSVRNLRCSNL